MGNGRTSRLSEVADGVIRPLNQTELKAATALLKDLVKQEPGLADHLAAEGRCAASFYQPSRSHPICATLPI